MKGRRRDKARGTGLPASEDKIIFGGRASKKLPPPLQPPPPLNMDNDCLRLQNHKSEVPTATEQLACLPIIRIINHADFMVFKRGRREAARDMVRLAPAGQRGRLGREGKGRAGRPEWEWGTGGGGTTSDSRDKKSR